jgi:hypothetical protein
MSTTAIWIYMCQRGAYEFTDQVRGIKSHSHQPPRAAYLYEKNRSDVRFVHRYPLPCSLEPNPTRPKATLIYRQPTSHSYNQTGLKPYKLIGEKSDVG